MPPSEWPLWTKGALLRDRIPAGRSVQITVKKKDLPIKKRDVTKRSILRRKLAEKEENQRELAAAKCEDMQSSEGRLNEEHIAEQAKKLELLQKEKHKLFLLLKKALQRDKLQQQNLALKKSQEARYDLFLRLHSPSHSLGSLLEEPNDPYETPSRRISNPAPANRIFGSGMMTHGM
jgi:hypothetical protein